MNLSSSVAIILALVVTPQIAGAQAELPGVTLTVDPCIEVDADQVQRVFAIELRVAMPRNASPSRSGPASEPTRVELVCAGESSDATGVIEIRVANSVTGMSLTRRIAPGPRDGRERWLAIAANELVVASWPRPRRSTTTTETTVQRPPSPPPPSSRWESTATLLGAAAWTGAVHAGLGVRLIRERVAVDGGWQFGGSVDMIAESSTQSASLGEVVTNSVSGSLVAHIFRQLGALRARGGLGVRLGAASMTGKANPGDNVASSQISGFTASPIVRADAAIHLLGDRVGGMAVTLSAEAGVHVVPLRALVNGRSVSSLNGPWAGGFLGMGWAW